MTDMGFMEVTGQGIVLREIREGLTVDEVQAATGARLVIPDRPGVMKAVYLDN